MANANQTETAAGEAPVLGMVIMFVAIFTAITGVVVSFFVVTGIEVGGWINFLVVMFAALFTGQLFVKRHGRMPEGPERMKLILGSFAASWLVSLVLFAGFALGVQAMFGDEGGAVVNDILQTIGALPSALLLAIGAIVSVVYLVAIWLGYGPLLRMSERR